MLFCLRAMRSGGNGKSGFSRFAFWTLNGGLLAMVVLSSSAGRVAADLGLGRTRVLVCPHARLPLLFSCGNVQMEPGLRRHDLLHRCGCACSLHYRLNHRAFAEADGNSRWTRRTDIGLFDGHQLPSEKLIRRALEESECSHPLSFVRALRMARDQGWAISDNLQRRHPY